MIFLLFFKHRSLRNARNYCRNPGNSGKKWPFCYVVNGLGFVQKEECEIHYCGEQHLIIFDLNNMNLHNQVVLVINHIFPH